MTITKGLITFESEGTEGGPFHSRVPHVPGDTSGFTIGRGYDMKEKSADKIKSDLVDAGVDESLASIISLAAGLSGASAKAFIKDNDLASCEISVDSQEQLFCKTYDEIESDVRRICDKADCVKIYGAVDWDALNPKIKDVLVDLRYRGDYTPTSRKRIQELVAENDLAGFTADLVARDNWSSVPKGRFNQRADYLNSDVGG
ncbi:MAG: hypothetical protein COB04_14130 [Gammaproteobacteria bacterium]|nr:MAG: hypothetical protein COB04_14130 [Gammaproteobacteria bacterium]